MGSVASCCCCASCKCCHAIQDCCRDLCGCCPCACCKTVKVEVETTEQIEHKIKAKEIPFGNGILHAGIQLVDNKYTSPILEVHLWRKEMTQTAIAQASVTQRVALGGIQTDRDTADRHFGPVSAAEQLRVEMGEEVIVIPVESIISIKATSAVNKVQMEGISVVHQREPQAPVSCCRSIGICCRKTFCCCCCCPDENKVEDEPVPTPVTWGMDAKRKVLITIEHMSYSNIHTPSHVQVLSPTDQSRFYKEKLDTQTSQFYLLDTSDFEQADFDSKRMEASKLCRLVTQLKSMSAHYPNENTLKQLIQDSGILSIGNVADEQFKRLVGTATITRSLGVTVPLALPPTSNDT